jgi:hypothetical protein
MKLRAGETLVYKTRPHWIVFTWAAYRSFSGRPNHARMSTMNGRCWPPDGVVERAKEQI